MFAEQLRRAGAGHPTACVTHILKASPIPRRQSPMAPITGAEPQRGGRHRRATVPSNAWPGPQPEEPWPSVDGHPCFQGTGADFPQPLRFQASRGSRAPPSRGA